LRLLRPLTTTHYKETTMNTTTYTMTGPSTEAQRRFIDSLARGKSMSELEILLAPAFAMHGNSFKQCETLNQNTKRLTKAAASRCIDLLKAKQ
jgi:hypothetical protein